MIRVHQGILTVPVPTGPKRYPIGCEPSAVIFLNTDRDSSGTSTDTGVQIGVGVSATQQWAITKKDQDNTNAFVFGHSVFKSDRCLGSHGELLGYSASYNGTFDDPDGDGVGFELDWTGTAGFTGRQIAYMAFIGDEDDLLAFAGNQTLPNTTGNHSYGGVGFQANFGLFVTHSTPTNDGEQQPFLTTGMAVGGGAAQQATTWALEFSGGGAFGESRTGMILGPAGNGEVSLVSFDADGLTVNNAQAYTSGTPKFGYLLFRCGTPPVLKTSTQPGADGNQAITGAGFAPGAAIAISSDRAFSNSLTADNAFSMGLASKHEAAGIDQYAHWHGGQNVSPTNNARTEDDAAFLWMSDDYNGGGTYKARATLNSFDADGITLNWDVTDAVTRDFYMVLFEAEAFPPCFTLRFRPVIIRHHGRTYG